MSQTCFYNIAWSFFSVKSQLHCNSPIGTKMIRKLYLNRKKKILKKIYTKMVFNVNVSSLSTLEYVSFCVRSILSVSAQPCVSWLARPSSLSLWKNRAFLLSHQKSSRPRDHDSQFSGILAGSLSCAE